ncbi:unnamed protein product, partial [Mycena citricolor]
SDPLSHSTRQPIIDFHVAVSSIPISLILMRSMSQCILSPWCRCRCRCPASPVARPRAPLAAQPADWTVISCTGGPLSWMRTCRFSRTGHSIALVVAPQTPPGSAICRQRNAITGKLLSAAPRASVGIGWIRT